MQTGCSVCLDPAFYKMPDGNGYLLYLNRVEKVG